MYRIPLILCLVTFSLYAGFWSSVAGGVVANQMSKKSSSSVKYVDVKQKKEMKIQQALYGLGFYNSKLDGNLNSMDSRLAIKELQKNYNLKISGILSKNNSEHLLYLHELYSTLIKIKNNDKSKRNQIYNEVDDTVALIKGEK